mgnify:CR=1 FL=1
MFLVANQKRIDGCWASGIVNQKQIRGCLASGIVNQKQIGGCWVSGIVNQKQIGGCWVSGIANQKLIGGCWASGIANQKLIGGCLVSGIANQKLIGEKPPVHTLPRSVRHGHKKCAGEEKPDAFSSPALDVRPGILPAVFSFSLFPSGRYPSSPWRLRRS